MRTQCSDVVGRFDMKLMEMNLTLMSRSYWKIIQVVKHYTRLYRMFISLSIPKTSFSVLGFPLLVFSPSGLPSSPLVFAVGWTGLKLSKRQVEQVQHSNPPSLSRTFPTPHAPQRERERERKTHTERQRGRKTETQWEATGGDERKMLTFGVFQNDTSHLTKHSQRIQSPCSQDFKTSALTGAYNGLSFHYCSFYDFYSITWLSEF